jgi:SRSO17 transposase
MNTTTRLPRAARTPLPALADFLQPFQVQFRRRESRAALERYLMGLLTDHPHKNCDTLAAVVSGTSEQQLQGLLTMMQWDAAALNRQRVERLLELPTEGDAVLIFDDTGFLKQGRSSVGVARQYTGTIGKVANCQVAVNCHYAERTIAWPVAARLYLPQNWCADSARRANAHIPEDIQFQTKPEIALALLDQARELDIPHACVIADADYGDNPNFLDGLETRDERYVVAIRSDFRVAVAGAGDPRLHRVDAVMVARAARRWRTIRWREGSCGWLVAQFHAVRAWRQDSQGEWHVGWLIGERPLPEASGDHAYYWSNFPTTTPLEVLVEYAHRRHHVERFHRHATLILLSYSFLVWQEWQHRQAQARTRGRPRGAFSPSAGSPPLLPGGDPPAGVRGAAVSGDRRTYPDHSARRVSTAAELTK